MRQTDLKYVTGKTVKGWYEWLRANDCGCRSVYFEGNDKYRYCVCMGWHDYGDGPEEKDYANWKICWKIGWQTFDNGMQCDFDVDFDMPGPCNEQGDVYDTLEEVGEIKTMKDWNRLASAVNKAVKEVFKCAVEIDGKAEE